jgi:BMFP domain-containing protein YqiC
MRANRRALMLQVWRKREKALKRPVETNMQTQNPMLDEFAKMMTGAAGAMQGIGEEAKSFWRAQTERMIADMDLVRRDEFEAVKTLAQTALEKIAVLEAQLAAKE